MFQKIIVFCALLLGGVASGQFTVSGRIVDENNKPLVGCHIHVKNKNANSNDAGLFVVRNIASGQFKIYISNFGYKSIEETIVVNKNLVFNATLVLKINSLKDVVVSQKRNSANNSILEQKIKLETIEKYSSQSLGDALREVAGVSVLRTGSNIVKPVVNGLSSSRVPIISNNVRLEDQQWGVEHAPNFDVNAAGKITVIKGAAGLQYGGDAVGGLIIIEPIVVLKDTIYGKTIANVSSNGRGGTISTDIHKGNFCDWSYNALGTFKYFGDRNAANYNLSNSGNRELNFAGDIKYVAKKFDISGFYSFYSAQIGILRASHIGSQTDLFYSISRQIPSFVNDFTYNLINPKQEVQHHLAKANFNYYVSENSSLAVQYSFQMNKRLEFDIRRGRLKDIPALDLELRTHNVKVDFKKECLHWDFKTGLNAENQQNAASALTEVRPLIPDYERNDFGIYAIANKPITDDLTIDFGLRYDFSNIEASKYYFKSRWNERGYNQQFSDFIKGESAIGDQWYTKPNFVFHNFSGSLGVHKKFNDNLNWYSNLSVASRNPNPSEFFSDGLHHSTGQIELGDLALKKEQSFKLSTTLQRKWSNFSIEVNPYVSSIRNFMYLRPFGLETTIRGAFPVWNYEQTNALLTGLDFHSSWDISNSFKHQLTFAAVNGMDLSNNRPLTAMPPLNVANKIQYSKKSFHGLVLELKNEVALRQTQFPDFNFNTNVIINNEFVKVPVDISTPPPAYSIWSFYSEMKCKTFRKSSATVAFTVQNITNTVYRDYLNTQRFFADELGRNFQIQLKINY